MLLTAACCPRFCQVAVAKGIQCGEVANWILNPVWARNLKEFSPVYTEGYKQLFFSWEKVNKLLQHRHKEAVTANRGPHLAVQQPTVLVCLIHLG